MSAGTKVTKNEYLEDLDFELAGLKISHSTHYHIDEEYKSRTIRLIAPAEHKIDGEEYAMEL